jgi:hypothetical protein
VQTAASLASIEYAEENFLLFFMQIKFASFFFSPHPHVKHYHIKKNSRGEFFLSEKHCCGSIPDLVNYHKHNSGGLASRLKASPCDRPVPATAGLSHGMYKPVNFLEYFPKIKVGL